jgi:hypothetical protein
MTGSNWKGRWVRDSIQSRLILEGNFAPLVGCHDYCRLLSSVWPSCDAAEPAVFLGFSGAGAKWAAGGGHGRCCASGRETSAGECNSDHRREDDRHSFRAAFFFAAFPSAAIILISATQVAALIRAFESAFDRLCD